DAGAGLEAVEVAVDEAGGLVCGEGGANHRVEVGGVAIHVGAPDAALLRRTRDAGRLGGGGRVPGRCPLLVVSTVAVPVAARRLFVVVAATGEGEPEGCGGAGAGREETAAAIAAVGDPLPVGLLVTMHHIPHARTP